MCRKEYIYGNTHLLTRSENVLNIKHVSQKHSICEGVRSCGKNAENIRKHLLQRAVTLSRPLKEDSTWRLSFLF
jgi:hypothetical protein